MSTLLALTAREWKAFWYSPIAYGVGACFLFAQGWIFYLLMLVLNDPRVDPTLNMTQLFFGTFFYWLFILVMCPLLTMRTFSEEKRLGTLEVLLAAPVTDGQVVLSKFLGAWASFCVLWASTAVYFLILRHYTALDWGPIFTGYVGTWLVGGVFVAVGVFASSLTRHQAIAFFLGLVLMVFLFSVGFLNSFVRDPGWSAVVQYVSIVDHFRDFARGILDSRPVIFYLSLALAALFLTARAIADPRWRV